MLPRRAISVMMGILSVLSRFVDSEFVFALNADAEVLSCSFGFGMPNILYPCPVRTNSRSVFSDRLANTCPFRSPFTCSDMLCVEQQCLSFVIIIMLVKGFSSTLWTLSSPVIGSLGATSAFLSVNLPLQKSPVVVARMSPPTPLMMVRHDRVFIMPSRVFII